MVNMKSMKTNVYAFGILNISICACEPTFILVDNGDIMF